MSILKVFYADYKCAVKSHGAELKWFDVKTGVRQGCVISPFLFIIAVDYLMKKIQNDYTLGLRWNFTTRLNYLAYADDLAIFSTKYSGIQNYTDKLAEVAQAIGLKININKTKMLKAGHHSHDSPNVQVNSQDVGLCYRLPLSRRSGN